MLVPQIQIAIKLRGEEERDQSTKGRDKNEPKYVHTYVSMILFYESTQLS